MSSMLSQQTSILFRLLLNDTTLLNDMDTLNVDWASVLREGLVQRIFVETYERLQQVNSDYSKATKLNAILQTNTKVYDDLRRRSLAGVEIVGKIASLFETHDIQHVFIKTLEYFPNFGSDIDILVRTDDMAKAKTALLRSGFRSRQTSLPDKVLRKFACVHPISTNYVVELYPQMSRIGEKWSSEEEIIRNKRVWRYSDTKAYIPSDDHNFLLTCIHAVYRHGEITMKETLNVMRIIQNDKMDWLQVKANMRKLGIASGARFLLAFVNGISRQLISQNHARISFDDQKWLKFGAPKVGQVPFYEIPLSFLVKAFLSKVANDLPIDLKSALRVPLPLLLIMLKRLGARANQLRLR